MWKVYGHIALDVSRNVLDVLGAALHSQHPLPPDLD